MRQASGIFVSFPKSGRTWIRVFYYSYLSFLAKKEFSWTPDDFPREQRIFFTHDRWEHRMIPGLYAFLRGKHLIPPDCRNTRKLALLIRDPRDVAVSLYFDFEKRENVRGTNFGWKSMSMAEMLRHPKYGLPQIIDLMNGWIKEWEGAPNFRLMRYEDCRQDEATHLGGLLEFYGLGKPDPDAFQAALQYCRFDAMKKRESSMVMNTSELRPGNSEDPDSFKTRRGKIGGYADYFSEDDMAYAATLVKELDPSLGYLP